MLWLTIVLVLATFIYFVLIKPFRYWKSKRVHQMGLFEIWAVNLKILLKQISQPDLFKWDYETGKKGRYFGSYQFLKPILYLIDPDLIKQITVKDFDHFLDHNPFITEEIEPLWGKSLVALTGDKWKDMRATLSPSFTSSKMRAMFSLMVECCEQFVDHFQSESTRTITLDFKDAFTRFTNDVIASTAFGVNCNSLKNPENEFYMMGKEATLFKGFSKSINFMLIIACPKLAKVLGLKVFSNNINEFFRKLVKTNMEFREKNGIVRPDMLHLLMEAKNGRLRHETQSDITDMVTEESGVGKDIKHQNKELSDDDVTAQALVFFFAGFESVATLMAFTAHELAINVDIQKKLIAEIDSVLKECNGPLTYEALLKMKYMDMVVSEVLRKWPIAIATDRMCTKPYTIQPVNSEETPVYLDKGDMVCLPIYGLHRDSQYFPDPERFDPERFSDENKDNIPPYVYIPFGVGPRNCIGNRFALLETKSVLFHILAKFEITVVDKTVLPITLVKNQFNLIPEGGFWFGLKPRTKM